MSSHRLGLPVIVAATVAVVVLGVAEAAGGLAVVTGTALPVAAVLLLLTLVGALVRLVGRRTGRRWSGFVLAGLATVSVVLALLVVTVAIRGHTASSRFEDAIAALPLPADYRPTSVEGADTQHQGNPEYAARAWTVPPSADACAEIDRAFRVWTQSPVQAFSRGAACAVATSGQDENAEVSLSRDGRRVVLEMWLDGESLIHF